MRFLEYENKDTKEKLKAIDAMSILETMKELEDYNGVSNLSIAQNYYELKRQVRDVIVATEEEKGKKGKKVDEGYGEKA